MTARLTWDERAASLTKKLTTHQNNTIFYQRAEIDARVEDYRHFHGGLDRSVLASLVALVIDRFDHTRS